MSLIFVTKDFAVDPAEVACLEHYDHYKHDPSPSGSSWKDHEGTIVIQKNGRKTYVRDLTVEEVHALIFGKDVSPKTKMLPQLPQQTGIHGNG